MYQDNASRLHDVLAAALTPGQDIVIGQGFGFPRTLVAALSRHRERLRGSRIFVGLVPAELPELPGVGFETFFPSGPFGTAAGLRARDAQYCRCSLYELACAFRDGTRKVDVALALATPATKGRHSLGLAVDFIAPAIERADAVVLEIAWDLPWTGDASTIRAGSRIATVPSIAGPIVAPAPAGGGDPRLAENILPYVPDGAALEFGMGKWFGPLVERLAGERRGLRLSTGSLGDWLPRFAASGALDIAGGIRATAAGGSRAFYDALADLPIELAPAHVTHDPAMLGKLPCFRAINSVLEVDLLGRANSEYGHDGRRGGLGGLPDYAHAAAANPDGLSIVALSSASGGVSRIVPRLPEDHVSLPGEAVEIIVTEQGSADLRGKPPRERARAILSIAAPALRAKIEREARALELI